MCRCHATAATILLAAFTVVSGCTANADTEPPGGSGPTESATDGREATDDAPTEDRPPEVPPLHPAIDGLDEAIVRITTTEGDRVEVAAKVAASDADRRRGLMEVTDLPEGTGMLFVFDEERTSGFWMWNTLVELDIAFATAEGEIVAVETMVPCTSSRADCPVTAPEEPYVTALEAPGGSLAGAGVTAGARLTWSEPVPAG